MAKGDYYRVLGLTKSATGADIKKAYRKLAREFHPDLHPGDKRIESRFKEINEAYGILGDAKSRKEYDLAQEMPFSGMGGMGGMGGRGGRGGMGGRGGQGGMGGRGGHQGGSTSYGAQEGGFNFRDFGLGGFEDIFGDVFGGKSKKRSPVRGADIEYTLGVDFLQAIKGAEVKITVKRSKGSERLTVKIPPGVRDGSKVRVAKKGDVGSLGGAQGDLFIITRVRPHKYFRRVGNDIHVEVPVTINEAILGANIKVPTIDGMTTIKISPGTQGGQKLRLKEKGVKIKGERRRGDQFININIAIPKRLNAKSKELVKEISLINPYDPRAGIW